MATEEAIRKLTSRVQAIEDKMKDEDELQKLSKRAQDTGSKTISHDAINKLLARFQAIKVDEDRAKAIQDAELSDNLAENSFKSSPDISGLDESRVPQGDITFEEFRALALMVEAFDKDPDTILSDEDDLSAPESDTLIGTDLSNIVSGDLSQAESGHIIELFCATITDSEIYRKRFEVQYSCSEFKGTPHRFLSQSSYPDIMTRGESAGEEQQDDVKDFYIPLYAGDILFFSPHVDNIIMPEIPEEEDKETLLPRSLRHHWSKTDLDVYAMSLDTYLKQPAPKSLPNLTSFVKAMKEFDRDRITKIAFNDEWWFKEPIALTKVLVKFKNLEHLILVSELMGTDNNAIGVFDDRENSLQFVVPNRARSSMELDEYRIKEGEIEVSLSATRMAVNAGYAKYQWETVEELKWLDFVNTSENKIWSKGHIKVNIVGIVRFNTAEGVYNQCQSELFEWGTGEMLAVEKSKTLAQVRDQELEDLIMEEDKSILVEGDDNDSDGAQESGTEQEIDSIGGLCNADST